jgi:hypothetical protein
VSNVAATPNRGASPANPISSDCFAAIPARRSISAGRCAEHILALPALRRRALIGTIFAGHVVELHLLQDNIFDQAKFRKRCAFDRSDRITTR